MLLPPPLLLAASPPLKSWTEAEEGRKRRQRGSEKIKMTRASNLALHLEVIADL